MNSFFKRLMIILAVFGAVFLVGCTKQDPAPYYDVPTEIVLGFDGDIDLSMTAETKATAVTSIASSTVYWGATTGGNAAGSSNETAKWSASSVTATSASKINTGKYQTLSPTSYNYYVANASFTIGASTAMTVANNNTDIIAGRLYGSNSATPTVTLNHIFARTGTLTLSAPSGASTSNVSWKIVGKSDINGTAGTYNMRTGAWTAASTKLTSATTMTSSSDFYLIPGTYTISVTFTYTHGDFTNTYTKSADVVLQQGKINNITATITEPATQIVIGTSITAWSANAVAATLP